MPNYKRKAMHITDQAFCLHQVHHWLIVKNKPRILDISKEKKKWMIRGSNWILTKVLMKNCNSIQRHLNLKFAMEKDSDCLYRNMTEGTTFDKSKICCFCWKNFAYKKYKIVLKHITVFSQYLRTILSLATANTWAQKI